MTHDPTCTDVTSETSAPVETDGAPADAAMPADAAALADSAETETIDADAEDALLSTAAAEGDDPACCCGQATRDPAYIPIHFTKSFNAIIPPDRGTICVATVDADKPLSDLEVVMKQAYGKKSLRVPIEPEPPVSLGGFNNKKVIFTLRGVGPEVTDASLLLRMDGDPQPEEPEGGDIVWAETTLPIVADSTSIAYGNGMFVVLQKTSNKIAWSTDGVFWYPATLPAASYGVAFGAGRFVFLPDRTKSSLVPMVTTDCVTFETGGGLPSNVSWFDPLHTGDRFLAIANGRLAESLNGKDWVVKSNTGIAPNRMIYGDGKVVLFGGHSNSSVSTDLVNWAPVTVPFNLTPFAALHDGEKFVALPMTNDKAYTSVDAHTWTPHDLPMTGGWSSMAQGGGKLVAVANSIKDKFLVSEDGMNWEPVAVPAKLWGAICYGNGVFVVIGAGGKALAGTFVQP